MRSRRLVMLVTLYKMSSLSLFVCLVLENVHLCCFYCFFPSNYIISIYFWFVSFLLGFFFFFFFFFFYTSWAGKEGRRERGRETERERERETDRQTDNRDRQTDRDRESMNIQGRRREERNKEHRITSAI